jgi:hypothetical protein
MSEFIVRALVALLLAGLLWAQARAAGERVHRRRAYQLAAGALLAFAGSNAALAAGANGGQVQQTVAVVLGLALLAGAAVELARSARAGEMRQQRDEVAAAAEAFRERRQKERADP